MKNYVGSEYKIGKWNSILYRYGQNYLGKKMEAYGIGSGQAIFMISLFHKDGVSQEELANHLKIDKATVAKSLKKLEESGYVTRLTDSADKRAYKVHITEKGQSIRSAMMDAIQIWEATLLAGMTEDEKLMVANLLEKMAHNAFKHQE